MLFRSERVIDDYFSAKSVAKLRDAIAEIPVDVLDTMDECNELLQDLSVNYRKEGLYRRNCIPERQSQKNNLHMFCMKWVNIQRKTS